MNTTIIKLHGPDDATMFDLDELRKNLLRLSKSVQQPVKLIELIGRVRFLSTITSAPSDGFWYCRLFPTIHRRLAAAVFSFHRKSVPRRSRQPPTYEEF
jgi:hypothetical protein